MIIVIAMTMPVIAGTRKHKEMSNKMEEKSETPKCHLPGHMNPTRERANKVKSLGSLQDYWPQILPCEGSKNRYLGRRENRRQCKQTSPAKSRIYPEYWKSK